MKHLDEGTIHAWLDGALSDAEAGEASAHIASCADCAAKVAEARGIMAAASRILTSLDDVPAVVPKRAPVPASAPRPQRFWQASPWVTGIAAALLVTVGVREWLDRPEATVAVANKVAMRDSLRTAIPLAATPVDSGLRFRPVSQPVVKTLNAAPRSSGLPGRPAYVERSAGGAGSAASSRADETSRSATFEERQKVAVAVERAPAAAAPAEPKKSAMADELKASAAVMPAPQPAALTRVVAKDGKLSTDERLLAGCYRIEAPPQRAVSLGEAVKSAASAAREPRAANRLAPAASPAAAQPFEAPPIVRLDTTLTSQGRVLRSSQTGEAIGTWRAMDGDSVRLVMPLVGARAIATTSRVVCPSTPEGRP